MSIATRRRLIAAFLVVIAACTVVGWRVWRSRRADAELQKAIQAAKAGRIPESIRLLDSVLDVNPRQPLALLYRSQLARDAGDRELALALVRRVDDSSPTEAATARYFEASMLLDERRSREAERLLLRSIELNPRYLQSRERLAQLYVVQARGQAIREALDGVRGLRRLELDELVQYSDATGYLYNAAEHIPFIEACLKADPDDRESLIALSRYRLAGDQPESAEEPLQTGTARWPDEPRLVALLAELRIVQGRMTDAREILRQFSSEDSMSPEIWRSRGLLAFAENDWPRAAEYLEQAWLAIPDDLTIAYKLGHAWERVGANAAARALLSRSRTMDKTFLTVFRIRKGNRQRLDLLVPVLREVASFMLELGRLTEAQDWVEHARALLPGDATTTRLATAVAERRRTQPDDYADVRELVESARYQRRSSTEPALPALTTPTRSGSENRAGLADTQIRLTDVHAQAGVSFQYFTGQSEFKYLIETLGGAVAAFDYDGDGWPDLYFPQGGNVPGQKQQEKHHDRLFRNRGDGTFEDVTERAGLGDSQYSQGCTAGDYDNDGDVDLFVANFGTNAVFRNEGDGTFTDVTAEVGISGEHWSSSLALADLDRDGDLDLYVVTYVLEALKVCKTPDGTMSTCSPGNFPAEADVLYLNTGDGRFVDISAKAGILAPDGKGLGIVVADFNDDQLPDIYVANDGTPNFLFRNLGVGEDGIPHFEEIGLVAGCAVSADGASQAGMGIACGDLNEDGRLDLYVTNFYQEHNALYLNDGEMMFHDASREAGLVEWTKPLLGFGTQAIDFDLDGRLDLVTTNGHIDDFRSRGEPWKMPPQLFRNEGNLRFSDVSAETGELFRGNWLGRGLCEVDWNRDGRPDAVIVHQDRAVAILRNDTEPVGNWISLELRGVSSNRDAIGARIRYTCDGKTCVREIAGGDGYFAVNDRRQVLGLGSAQRVDLLEIDWPGGARQSWSELPARSSWIIREGASHLVEVRP